MTCAARAQCTRRSTDALTGTRPSTATGCWCTAQAFPRHARGARNSRRPGPESQRQKHRRPRWPISSRPNRASFERTYGWAWLLKLAEELHGWNDADGKRWSANLQPLADALVEKYLAFLPKQNYPIRTGVHPNTAFGLAFALDYARGVGDKKLEALIVERSRTYFGKDVNYPAAWEPGGEDFFSPSLMEADLMRRVMPQGEFAIWFHRFLPGLARNQPAALLRSAIVTDRTDPKLVHLDGLNLSRAWCMRNIAGALPQTDPARRILARSAAAHAEAALPYVTSGNYEGEHWLASFAVYLLTTPAP